MIIDDHEIVRRGIAEIVDRDDALEVVAEAGSVADAVRRADPVSYTHLDVYKRQGGASLLARPSGVTSVSTQIARATLSDFRHLVHTFRRLGVPLTRARTR